MFLGALSLLESDNSYIPDLSIISKFLQWENFRSEKLSWHSFIGEILSNFEHHFFPESHFFMDEQSGVMVFMEGSIYNGKELAFNLSISDDEIRLPYLVFTSFLKWGPNFANQLNGDFAICIYQIKKGEAFFFRDHLGILPLAVSILNDAVYFASDPMGLAKALYGNEKVDVQYIRNLFLSVGYDDSIMPHKNLIKIKPGHFLRVSKHNVEQKKYWFPERIQIDHSFTQKQVFADLNFLVRDAVNIRVDKKYTASAHLSGGLDSGVVASFSRQAYKHQSKFYGFSWSPDYEMNADGLIHDERLLVAKIATENNIEPVFSTISMGDYHSAISDWRHPSEMFYERQTVQAAKERGINLIFSGWGGDEFISIGHRGIDADLIRQLHWRHFLKKYPICKPKPLISAILFNALFPSLRRSYSKNKVDNSIYPYIKKVVGSRLIPKDKRFQYTSRLKVHLQLLEMGHLGARAADWYVHGQRNGIEYRYPLLDKRIVEYMLKVPSRCLVGNLHYRILLREIGKDVLPEEVLKNTSKDDPLKSKQFFKIVNEVKKQFISELEVFRSNPNLDFVDFDLLEKNLPTILDNIEKGKEEDGSSIFYYLKSAHEFTKGYYN